MSFISGCATKRTKRLDHNWLYVVVKITWGSTDTKSEPMAG